jgi:hypothetical protein
MKITKKLTTKLHEGTRKEGRWEKREAGKIGRWEDGKKKYNIWCQVNYFLFSGCGSKNGRKLLIICTQRPRFRLSQVYA